MTKSSNAADFTTTSDPADFTVAAVKGYLGSLPGSDLSVEDQAAEAARVLDAERGGEARDTILSLADTETQDDDAADDDQAAALDDLSNRLLYDELVDGGLEPEAAKASVWPGYDGEVPEGREQPQEPAQEPLDPYEAAQVRRTEQQDLEKSRGYLGDTGPTPEGTVPVRSADQAAPSDVSTDPYDAVVQANESDANPRPTLDLGVVPTVTDTETPTLTGEAYQRGYFGTLPGDDQARPDLTLAAVVNDESATEQEN